MAECTAEFVGTFMLVYTIGCNVLTGGGVWAGTSIACVLMVCIYALGGVSGAHFNPAVSVALGLSGKREWKDVGIYCGVQMVAGALAGLAYAATLWSAFNLEPTAGFKWWQAGLAEILYTCMLCFVILNVAASNKHSGKNQFYGLAIGFVIVAGAYGAGHISGGCFNPAVAFGIDVSSAGMGLFWCLPYIIFELVGACLAAGLFRVVRPHDFNTNKDNRVDDFPYPLSAKLAAEFIGTYFLVLTVGLNVIGGSPAAAWSIAASLMCMVFALGSVSGAHFNPAVTFAIVLRGRQKFSPQDAGMYMGVQILAGIIAAFTYTLMENGETFALAPGKGYGWAQVAVAEVAFTFLLAFVVLSVATVRNPLSEYFGLAIGSCVTAGGFAIGGISGGSLNPAVSFGISSAHILNGGHFWHCLAYSVFELLGGALAAGVFLGTRPSEFSVSKSALPPSP